ncbi:MMPL family transporter [Phytoactinopolyspora endophytica]|uniref:MMPL family transporter n=1 Tax=Phytoactinopolyspora endophytica TaxID=1642495 RepID=UPI00101DF6EB|nr:MMPL family transporter [Phytoactinopolyspora endophytica]
MRTSEPTSPRRGALLRRAVPWFVLAFWVIVLLVAVPVVGKLGDATTDSEIDYLPASAQSTQVAEIQQELPGGGTTDMFLVYQRDSGLSRADRDAAEDHVAEIAAHYSINGMPEGNVSDDETTLMYPLAIDADEAGGEGEDVELVRELVADHPDGLLVQVTGPAGLEADMDEAFEGIDETLVMATMLVVTVLLILTYRSPFLWLLPLVAVGAAAVTSMAGVYALVRAFDITVSTMSSSIMIVLVFGVGTDYALLLVARYREELRRHHAPADAMIAALRGTGPAILTSAGTVAAGLLCMIAADLNSSSGLGPVGAVGVVCALVAMTTLLPAILVLLGRGVFWPLVPVHGTTPRERRGFYSRVGALVTGRPITVLAAGAMLVGSVALGALNLPGDLRSEDSFTDRPESVAGMETLAAAFPEQSSQPITVLADASHSEEVLTSVRGTDGVADAEMRRSADGWAEISAFPVDEAESAGEAATIELLRAELATIDGAGALVGGESAQHLDVAATASSDRALVIPLALVAVFVLLALLLRSLLAPLVLVAAVVAVWGAAIGLGGLVFGPVFGFEGTDPEVPMLSFVFLVALGVDYGIFLMHRTREEALRGAPAPAALVSSLKATGTVIASAGIVLAATFSVLTVLPLVMMVELGFVIAVGVLLDTFLVRAYLVPAAAALLGTRIWWPGRLSKAPQPAPEPVGLVRR